MSHEAEIEQRYFKDQRSREQFRREMLGGIPGWYSPTGHLLMTTGIGVFVVALALIKLENLVPLELLVVPVVFVISNVTEWHAHRNLLHRRMRPLGELYDRHTPQHHRVYRYGDMAIRSWRELRLVLIPAIGVAGIIVASLPGAALAGWLFGQNAGWLFLLTSGAYVTSYELTHLAYHLPKDSFVGRRSFVRAMREHHARHHDPRLMQKWNFNVTVPLADWIFGTLAPKELLREAPSAATETASST
jgi:sterol desaturase/sphingolipid hydroxylase (fatty acid hydroxylase superfamily)